MTCKPICVLEQWAERLVSEGNLIVKGYISFHYWLQGACQYFVVLEAVQLNLLLRANLSFVLNSCTSLLPIGSLSFIRRHLWSEFIELL